MLDIYHTYKLIFIYDLVLYQRKDNATKLFKNTITETKTTEPTTTTNHTKKETRNIKQTTANLITSTTIKQQTTNYRA